MIANDVVAVLKEDPMFDEIVAVNPGFINIRVAGDFVAEYLNGMQQMRGCRSRKRQSQRPS